MRFGARALSETLGSTLAHTLKINGSLYRKGRIISAADIKALREAGITDIIVATPDPEDVSENDAAARIAAALEARNITLSAPYTGRVNLHAQRAGLFTISSEGVTALNSISPSITLSCLMPKSWVAERQMVATIKIIPYAVRQSDLEAAEEVAQNLKLDIHSSVCRTSHLILTRTPGLKETLIAKGETAVRERITALGLAAPRVSVCPHREDAIAAEFANSPEDLTLILTASATSDLYDTAPVALRQAGGTVERFGMPVDPGNLLFTGTLNGRPVIGLPGCARSPALNGADWVLQRIIAGMPVSDAEFASMGVGGLLKEIPTRPHPRATPNRSSVRPEIAILMLAAGASSRMKGRDKLLEDVSGEPLLQRCLQRALASKVDHVLVTLPDLSHPRADTIPSDTIIRVPVPNRDQGLSASIKAGIAGLPETTDAVMLMFADMPDITPHDIDLLCAAFSPEDGREIIRATTADGTPGHPVLFGRRFFEGLQQLDGDHGARDILRQAGEFITDIVLSGDRATTDLDTPKAWTVWRSKNASGEI